MLFQHPGRVILIGFFLVVLGVIIPVLMVSHAIEPTFFLSFLSFAASVTGLFLGIIGAAMFTRRR